MNRGARTRYDAIQNRSDRTNGITLFGLSLACLSVFTSVHLFDCNARYNIETLDLFSVGNMTTAAYTSVLCPNRSPVQGVQQNDQMYGDNTARTK